MLEKPFAMPGSQRHPNYQVFGKLAVERPQDVFLDSEGRRYLVATGPLAESYRYADGPRQLPLWFQRPIELGKIGVGFPQPQEQLLLKRGGKQELLARVEKVFRHRRAATGYVVLSILENGSWEGGKGK